MRRLFRSGTQARVLDRICDAPPLAVFGTRHLTNRWNGLPLLQVVRESDLSRRDIYADRFGVLDLADIKAFSGNSTVDVSVVYDQSGSNRHLSASAGERFRISSLGSLNTNQSLPVLVATGASRMTANVPFVWNTPIVMNMVLVRAGDARTPAWIAGNDSASTAYRDIQVFAAAASNQIGLGEDLNTMTPNNSTITANTVSILTVIRNATGVPTRGYIIQNGLVTSTFNTESQATNINPSRFVIGGDPDTLANFMPVGWGFQEIILFNGQPPSTGTLNALHLDQGRHFNIPVYGTLSSPVSITRSLVTSSGNPLVTSNGLQNITYR